MLYIISGTREEAEAYAKSIFKNEWLFIPDSEFSMVFRNQKDYQIIFIGSFKKRRDIIDRLMEARDLLISKLNKAQSHIIYKENGEILSQNEFNVINDEIKAYKNASK